MKRIKKISVIIPNWNGINLLKNCLPSLNNQTFKDFEVIIVDNGSTDGSVDFIEKNYPGFRVLALKKNTGFAHAVNLGIKFCIGKLFFLLNNDTKLDKNCLKALSEASNKHPNAGMIACKVMQFYNPKLIDSAGDWVDSVGHANNIGIGENRDKFNKGYDVFLVTGGAGMIRREVFEQIGFLDEDYFAYFEDVDFCLRAQMAGFKAWFEPKAMLFHMNGETSNKNLKFKEYLQFRNMTMTIIKDYPLKFLLSDFNLLKIILVNIHTVWYLANKGYLISALKAEAFIIYNLPKLLRKRYKIQKEIRVPIEYIAKNIRPKKITFGFLKKGI